MRVSIGGRAVLDYLKRTRVDHAIYEDIRRHRRAAIPVRADLRLVLHNLEDDGLVIRTGNDYRITDAGLVALS